VASAHLILKFAPSSGQPPSILTRKGLSSLRFQQLKGKRASPSSPRAPNNEQTQKRILWLLTSALRVTEIFPGIQDCVILIFDIISLIQK
jgi:hypothetical protein